jgi:hypothetical protein
MRGSRFKLVALAHKILNLLCGCPENVEHSPTRCQCQGGQHDRNPKIDIHKTLALLKQIPTTIFIRFGIVLEGAAANPPHKT